MLDRGLNEHRFRPLAQKRQRGVWLVGWGAGLSLSILCPVLCLIPAFFGSCCTLLGPPYADRTECKMRVAVRSGERRTI